MDKKLENEFLEYLKRDDWYYYIPFNFIGCGDENPYIVDKKE